MNALRNVCAAAVLCGLSLSSSYAYADAGSAETLFQAGIEAMKREDYAVACEAFDKSNRDDPSPGTQLNLAICYEKQKKWASAWTWYRSAGGLARQRNQQARVQSAEEAATRLAPQLHRVVVNVKNPPADMVVKRDNVEVTAVLAGNAVPLPTDPGEHTFEVTATGKKPWTKAIVVPDTPATDTIDVVLENAAVEPTKPVASASAVVVAENDGGTQRTIGLVIGGAGILTGLAAIPVFLVAKGEESKRDDLNAKISGEGRAATDNERLSINSRNDAAKSNQLISIFLGAGAAVMVGLGAVLYVTAPKAKSPAATRLVPTPLWSPGFGGLGLTGSF